jgi:hypothetical protein
MIAMRPLRTAAFDVDEPTTALSTDHSGANPHLIKELQRNRGAVSITRHGVVRNGEMRASCSRRTSRRRNPNFPAQPALRGGGRAAGRAKKAYLHHRRRGPFFSTTTFYCFAGAEEDRDAEQAPFRGAGSEATREWPGRLYPLSGGRAVNANGTPPVVEAWKRYPVRGGIFGAKIGDVRAGGWRRSSVSEAKIESASRAAASPRQMRCDAF